MKQLKSLSPWLVNIFPALFVYSFIFRSLLSNLKTHLLDWFDFPYYVWTIDQNIDHFRRLQLNGFFNTNIYYPHQGTLLFSDLLLPQSLIGLVFSFFTPNPILIFNLVLLCTLVLNLFAFRFFWSRFFKNQITLTLIIFLSAVMPFFFLQLGHLQMMTFWPFFWALGLLVTGQYTARNALMISVLSTVQFTASVYLGIFLLFVIGVWLLIEIIFKKQPFLFASLAGFIFYFLIFYFSLNGFFIYKYLDIKKAYDITRVHGEYVVYAAHLTDYLFIPLASWGNHITAKWQKFNWHGVGELASYPGTSVLLLSLIGLGKASFKKNRWSLEFQPNPTTLFFLCLVGVGLVFSLGPRLAVNGQYVNIPLPYILPLKVLPFFEPIRATARWSFLFYLGLLFFAGQGFQKITGQHAKKWLVAIVIAIWYTLEMVPLTKTSSTQAYYNPVYKNLESECGHEPKVLLEYPITESHPEAHVITNLSYKTQQMLASTHHECYLVNGYSGFEPKEYLYFEQSLEEFVRNNQRQEFYSLLNQKEVEFVKLNSDHASTESALQLNIWFEATPSAKLIASESGILLFKVFNPND